MMRRSAVAGIVLSLVLTGSAEVRAQGGSPCTLLENPGRTVNIQNLGTPFETWYVTDAVFECPGGRRIVARTATYSAQGPQITLMDDVQVDQPDRSLRSQFAQYFPEARQLHARTNVVLRELDTGSVITSEQLDAYQESPQWPQGLVVATGGSPRAVLFRQGQPGAARDSTILEAHEIRIVGEESFRGTGSAVLYRDSVVARGAAIDYSRPGGRLEVTGNGQVELPSYQLTGDSIIAMIGEDEQIREVLTRHDALLQSKDLRVTAPAIRLLFENGGVSRLVAMDWPARAGAESGARPLAESTDFRVQADSLDVLAPEQQLTEAIAFGDAVGERIMPDSLRALLPEAPEEILALIGRDWVRGDTVRARFAPNPRAEADTTAPARVMEQLTARGEQAQSMYSIRDESRADATLSFNYLVADYIEVNFANGTVATVNAAGNARGVYLQPAEAAAVAPAETVGMAGRRR